MSIEDRARDRAIRQVLRLFLQAQERCLKQGCEFCRAELRRLEQEDRRKAGRDAGAGQVA